ncbi:alpha/beta hydrolase [Marinoscillum furvescens]|uniref:Acetyl esterase/lipase n=1 Tax=Marinoscillum furvescens DSM 4134 TaxID=1122208 RepID=A0A3D9L1V6_MARFU|nr:alpha/beta hydrolase [Marinoscillum furvescens]RED95975.1 acetyl esterase/lipase [Marinoscillum furvescens DSM 4134]
MRSILFAILLTLSIYGHSQSVVIPLWQDDIPNAVSVAKEETSYGDDYRRVRNIVTPTIEVYLPTKAQRTGTAVLIIPGGGYYCLVYDKEGTDVAKWLNGYGITGVVLKHRLPDEDSNEVPHLSPLMDAKRAITLIRENSEEWGLDQDKIGVMGFSAGGHLASLVGTRYTDASSHPDFMTLVYPVISMLNSDFVEPGTRERLLGDAASESLYREYSSELNVSEETPPTFIAHCADDRIVAVQNSIEMYCALERQHIPAEMHLYPKGGHGFGLAVGNGEVENWKELFIRWVKSL